MLADPPEREPFDVAVIGGGIIGAGVARDAAQRGLRVVLLERHDFGSGTTAGSTRLAHGGLRYLSTADFRLVRLDLRERETLLRIAPHLVKPLPFLLPFAAGHVFSRLRLRTGMLLYDALSLDKSLPSHRILDTAALREFEPALDPKRFAGGAVFFDAQVHSPERLTLENVIAASEHGAVARTYTEVTGALHGNGRVSGVSIKDLLSGRESVVPARLIVNAAGPWFDGVASRIERPHSHRVRMTKGVHVACEPFTRHAVVLESAVDGRVVFAIPWAGYTWLGTTDTDFSGDPATAAATADDVRYLIDSVAPHLPVARQARSFWTSAGVRALARARGAESAVSRMHRVVADTPGLVSVVGGKITGYRAIAEEVTDLVCRQLGHRRASQTAATPLPGGGGAASGLAHLDAIYGGRATRVRALMDEQPDLAVQLSPSYPDVAAQVVFSVRHEWCQRLEDFMLRRSYLGFQRDRGSRATEAVSWWMQRELSWSDDRRRDEVETYRARMARDRAAVISGNDTEAAALSYQE